MTSAGPGSPAAGTTKLAGARRQLALFNKAQRHALNKVMFWRTQYNTSAPAPPPPT